MIEIEIEVPSMKAAKEFLEALGYSHRSYQEKEEVLIYYKEMS